MEFHIDEESIQGEYNRLAEALLLQKELVVNNARFNFTEIEFYYYCEIHQDAFTHEHNELAGNWRFHNQGFDITLRGDSGFGGILIRGVEYGNEFINGPRRVLFKIMNYLNQVHDLDNQFGLVNKPKEDSTIFKTFRHGLKTPNLNLPCDSPDYYRTASYRFIIKPQSFDRKQFEGSEKIAKGFKDKNLSEEFLGYHLSI